MSLGITQDIDSQPDGHPDYRQGGNKKIQASERNPRTYGMGIYDYEVRNGISQKNDWDKYWVNDFVFGRDNFNAILYERAGISV